MRYLIIILILIVVGQKTYADYEPTPLPQLIIDSDLILQGKIIRHDSTTFTLIISDLIKGDYTLHSIQIQKFEDWTCANRLPEYQTGQEEIIFLKANTKTNEWFTMGAANEGELLIQKDSIIYEDIYYDSKSGCKELDYFDFKICGWIYLLTDFKNGVSEYIRNFEQIETQYMVDYSLPEMTRENSAYDRMIAETTTFLIFKE